ncbi:N-acetylmuramoyl-L-alanine amidase [Propionicimonas paludicola]|uniref:N-acetylmuramoyl-L-alanine amidase n=1 Tax=Propionicimonas paludicola TaxID=185243 RepID=A0A2A9CWC1_9ACTN|nr:N-acetylmuramoyl-L-alanine amidase [Propionicimonas paludicola]
MLAALLLTSCAAAPPADPERPSPAATSAAPSPASSSTPTQATPTKAPSPSQSAPPAAGRLDGRVIVIDPGHNRNSDGPFIRHKVPAGNGKTKPCNSTGTATNADYAEHAYNWAQANALAKELRERGATVRLTRADDAGNGPCVNTRASLANQLHADLLISIHADGSFSKGARGFHVILSTVMAGGSGVEAESKKLAEQIRSVLTAQTGMPRSTYIGRGTALSPRSDIATLNFAKVPAVMMEMGNMRNAKDAALLTSSAWRTKAATALADAISEFLD